MKEILMTFKGKTVLAVAASAVVALITQSAITDDPERSDGKIYTHATYGFSFSYPAEWVVREECSDEYLYCSIAVTGGRYTWRLSMDPIVTGGGFGFIFDGVLSSSSTQQANGNPAGFCL